jgi:hypothetical protein
LLAKKCYTTKGQDSLLFKECGVISAKELLQNSINSHFPETGLTFQAASVFIPRQIADTERGSRLQFNI